MKNFKLYMPLLEKSSTLMLIDEKLKSNITKKEKGKLKEIKNKLTTELFEEIKESISKTLDTRDPIDLISQIVYEMDELKEQVDKSWHEAIVYLKKLFIEQITKESKKSPLRRKLERHGWWIGLIIAFVVYCFIWYFNIINVTDPIETKNGIIQRSKTFNKSINYDECITTEVSDGTFLISLWCGLARPTDKEIDYAVEFGLLSGIIYNMLKQENLICNANLIFNEKDWVDSNNAVVKIPLEFINEEFNHNLDVPGTDIIMTSFIEKFPCK